MSHHKHKHIKKYNSTIERIKELFPNEDPNKILHDIRNIMPPLDNNVKRPSLEYKNAEETKDDI